MTDLDAAHKWMTGLPGELKGAGSDLEMAFRFAYNTARIFLTAELQETRTEFLLYQKDRADLAGNTTELEGDIGKVLLDEYVTFSGTRNGLQQRVKDLREKDIPINNGKLTIQADYDSEVRARVKKEIAETVTELIAAYGMCVTEIDGIREVIKSKWQGLNPKAPFPEQDLEQRVAAYRPGN